MVNLSLYPRANSFYMTGILQYIRRTVHLSGWHCEYCVAKRNPQIPNRCSTFFKKQLYLHLKMMAQA